ncbi:outer membrane protein [Bartonella taylorii]|uniref:outer membrane protein n=1 Tax=Bartonella taylorii TaxID=33046 RepID=UPI001ABA0DB4|nr:outer membrane beta-barrel protein [Bartonella taylorii]
MNTKRLITASIFALISASAVRAADVMVPHQSTTSASSAFVAPTFTWSGFYLGGQVGGFSSKTDMSIIGKNKTVPLNKDLSPKLSGFEGGLYAGSNIDLGDSFVFGIDTDLIWSGQKHTKTITIGASDNAAVDNLITRSRRSASGTPSTTPIVPSGGSSKMQTASETTSATRTSLETGTVTTTKPVALLPAAPEAKPAAPSSETGRTLSLGRSAQVVSSIQISPATSEAATRTASSKPTALTASGTGDASRSHYHSASNGTSHGSQPHGASHGVIHSGGSHSHAANPYGAHQNASNLHVGQKVAGHSAQGAQAADKNATNVYGIEQVKQEIAALSLEQGREVESLSHTLKQNLSGATRARIGFAADRFMPYIAGGIAYTQLQDTISISFKKGDGRVVSSKNLTDETKTMIGYTLGGGVDFAMLDNVIVRAEYRYSDFGKKKFAKEKLEIRYKTNDFRVGVAYKF